MKSTSKGIAKAKYVVETHCGNGNVFLHGPFGSKSKAEVYVEYCEEDDLIHRAAKGYRSSDCSTEGIIRMSTYKIRMVMHPDKWTKAVK